MVARSFVIKTYGCQMNDHDSNVLRAKMVSLGHKPARFDGEADIVIFNTCCIRENADEKFYGQLSHYKRMKEAKPDLVIAVAGCLAQKDAGKIFEKAPFVDAVVGTGGYNKLLKILESGDVNRVLDVSREEDFENFYQHDTADIDSEGTLFHKSGYVTIQNGCNNKCAFCIVPSVRGEEISRPFNSILNEVNLLAKRGITEVTFLGQNVNSYGRDLTLKYRQHNGAIDVGLVSEHHIELCRSMGQYKIRPLFSDLLRAAGAVPNIKRIRFTSPHPKDLTPEIVEAMASTKEVCEQLHLPVQSGSNRILALMRRGYTREKYLEKVNLVRSSIPDIALTTDIIVGFPGETEADFDATVDLVMEARFDSAYTFEFSPRPGTAAFEYKADYVDANIVTDRLMRLKTVVDRIALEKNQEIVGSEVELLVEGVSKKSRENLSGRTRTGKLVHFRPPDSVNHDVLVGGYVSCKITSAAPHFLRGEYIDLLQDGTTKKSLKLAHIN